MVPQDISRVILNLANNACYAAYEKKKAGGAEPATVWISTKSLGDKVEVTVRDNGAGIPPQVLEKIFNPFFTTKPPGEGTGLGLSISFDIVSEHRGELKVDSKAGEYAEFRVILPRA
jgi:signal transduction histidine kinase